MNKREAQRRLKLFYQQQYTNNYGGLSFFGNLFRSWFGWFQESRIGAVQTYLNGLQGGADVSLENLRTALIEPAESHTTTESTPLAEPNPVQVFASELIAVASSRISVSPDADLKAYPTSSTTHTPTTQITLGDLHGNAIKLIYTLVREGVLQGLPKSDYAELVRIYKIPAESLTQANLNKFNEILNKTELEAQAIKRVRLIGDVLCDRGMNDYYTLRVLATLQRLKVPLEIQASNHDVEFLSSYTQDATTADGMFAQATFDQGQSRSMENLRTLLRRFHDEIDGIKRDITSVYLPTVNLLNYSLSPNKTQITLYTHAPINLAILQQLAENFSVEYGAGTAIALAGTIDRINAKVLERGGLVPVYQFAREHSDKGRAFTQLQNAMDAAYKAFLATIKSTYPELHGEFRACQPEDLIKTLDSSGNGPIKTILAPTIVAYNAYVVAYDEYTIAAKNVEANPLHKIIWNRDELILPTVIGHDSIHFVHGHVGPGQHIRHNASNLDSYFGRSDESSPESTGIEPFVNPGHPFGAYCIHLTEGDSPVLVMVNKEAATRPGGGSPTHEPPIPASGAGVPRCAVGAGTGAAAPKSIPRYPQISLAIKGGGGEEEEEEEDSSSPKPGTT